jgi:hypothetical protein
MGQPIAKSINWGEITSQGMRHGDEKLSQNVPALLKFESTVM